MDPFTAIGLASSIITFVDLGQKVVSQANEIRKSASGSTKDDQSMNILAEEMAAFALKLGTAARPEDCTDGNEKALARLAKECRDTSAEIQAVLEKRQLKGKKSIWRAVKAAVRSKMTDEELLRLQERLKDHRAQLHLQFDHFKSEEYTKGLVELLKQSETNVAKLRTVDEHIADIQKGVTVENLSQSTLDQLQEIIGISTKAREQALAARLINSLSFAEMGKRNDEVAEAHEDTFAWILSDNDPACSDFRPKDQAQAEARDQLQRWLREGSGMFHISGKLGSGKSTLMKFLVGEPRTRSLLQQWAGLRRLVMAEFFFWRPGTDLQKSLRGLFRSLLHRVLSNAPHLAKTVMDAEWASGLSKPNGQETDPKSGAHFTAARIRSLFQNLLEAISNDRDHCFCFFIDGLDEFEETAEHDDRDLLDVLHQWARACPQSFKLCVSSREENVFMEMLGKNGRIRLHTVTQTDISAYVSSKLDLVAELDLREELTTRIIAAAQGIFLWVSLVCRRIRRRYSSRYSREDLLKDINLLPQEINALFAFLLDNQPDQDRDRAYMTLAIVLEADVPFFDAVTNTKHGSLSDTGPTLLGYSFLEEYVKDPAFAIKAADDENQDLAPDIKSIAGRIASAEKRLNDCTQGLVELIPIDYAMIGMKPVDDEPDSESAHESRESYPGTKGGPPVHRLGLTHRSVAEFLAQLQRRSLMEATLSRLEFDALDALSAFYLAEIPLQHERLLRSDRSGLLGRRYGAGLDSVPPFSFLEAYSKSMARRRASLWWATEETRATHKSPAICHHTTVSHVSRDIRLVNPVPPGKDMSGFQKLWVQDPIYLHAGFLNLNYVGWKLDRCSSKSWPSLADILKLALSNEIREPADQMVVPHIVDKLFALRLDPGDSLPEERHSSDISIPDDDSPPAGAIALRDDPIWSTILVEICLLLGEKAMRGLSRKGDARLEAHLHTLERFIEAGADARFRFRIVWRRIPRRNRSYEYKFPSKLSGSGSGSGWLIKGRCDLRKLPYRSIQVRTVAELLRIILPAGERKDRLLRLLEERPKEDSPLTDDDEWPVNDCFPEGWMEEVNSQDWDISDDEDDEEE